MPLSIPEFVARWQGSRLTERSAAQQHFLNLCEALGQPSPAAVDQTGETYTFEKGVRAVLDAYGWPHDLSDDQILERLLALNLERAQARSSAPINSRGESFALAHEGA